MVNYIRSKIFLMYFRSLQQLKFGRGIVSWGISVRNYKKRKQNCCCIKSWNNRMLSQRNPFQQLIIPLSTVMSFKISRRSCQRPNWVSLLRPESLLTPPGENQRRYWGKPQSKFPLKKTYKNISKPLTAVNQFNPTTQTVEINIHEASNRLSHLIVWKTYQMTWL